MAAQGADSEHERPVHREHLARDERRLVRREIRDRRGDVLGLAEAAERIGLTRFLKRNAGASPLPPHAKVYADAMEAVMGAVWLDGGLDAVRGVFARLDLPIGESLNEWGDNPKGRLQVLAQAKKPSRRPVYKVDSVSGPPHRPIVTVTVSVSGVGKATATAGSQRRAEIEAAARLLALMDGDMHG